VKILYNIAKGCLYDTSVDERNKKDNTSLYDYGIIVCNITKSMIATREQIEPHAQTVERCRSRVDEISQSM
jgi:hypothetical protein